MGFDTPDVLRQSGLEDSDTVQLGSYGQNSIFGSNTTSTSFTDQVGLFLQQFFWDEQFGKGTETGLRLRCIVIPGSGETVDIRVRNTTDSETAVAKTGITSGNTFSTTADTYRPTTTASNSRHVLQVKTDPGTNSSNIRFPAVDVFASP